MLVYFKAIFRIFYNILHWLLLETRKILNFSVKNAIKFKNFDLEKILKDVISK